MQFQKIQHMYTHKRTHYFTARNLERREIKASKDFKRSTAAKRSLKVTI